LDDIDREREERPPAEYRADYLIRTKSGDMRWLGDHSFPFRDPSGDVIGTAGILQDITERKRAEDETLRRNEHLAVLNETAQALSRLGEPAQIIEQIYATCGRVLNNSSFYVALYDEVAGYLHFPFYMVEGERRQH